MKKQILILSIFLVPVFCKAQAASRGAQSQAVVQVNTGITRALVIGISEYKEIEKLQYADKDAREFSNFLQSKSGGSVPLANIQLLLNQDANIGNIISALEWLKEESKSGDRVIIYFSGHGDVETLTDAQNGFLLTYNSPKKVYVAGALPIYLLKDYITTLGNRKVSSVLITDACRSGKLAGGQEGARMTSTALLNQWNNEIKIMSCQPGQFSLEGKEWGGGRGAFSYHLIDGLNGMADKNKDGEVTLAELESYVAEKVSIETQKLQEPIFEGKSKFSTSMSKVDSLTLKNLLAERSKSTPQIMLAGLKGAAATYNDADSSSARLFRAFENALERGKLLLPADSSAELYFTILETHKPEGTLTRIARRNLTAALLNNVQDLFNNYLDGKKFLKPDDLKKADSELQLTLKLLGESHPLYKSCLARQHFVRAANYSGLFYGEKITDSIINKTIALLDQAELAEPGAAYIYQSKGELYLKAKRYSEAEYWLEKAKQASPSWVLPHYVLGMVYSSLNRKQESIAAWEKAISMDTTMKTFQCTPCAFIHLGELYMEEGNTRRSLDYFEKAIKSDSSISTSYLSAFAAVLGNFKIRDIIILEKKMKTAESYIIRGRAFLSDNELHTAYGTMFYLRSQVSPGKKARKEAFDSAVYHLEQAYRADSTDASVLTLLADLYMMRDQTDLALDYYIAALKIDSLDPGIFAGLAEIYAEQGDYESSIDWVNQGLKIAEDSAYLAELHFLKAEVMLNFKDEEELGINDDQILDALEASLKAGFEDKSYLKSVFSPLKKNKRYQSLLKEYFTDKKS